MGRKIACASINAETKTFWDIFEYVESNRLHYCLYDMFGNSCPK